MGAGGRATGAEPVCTLRVPPPGDSVSLVAFAAMMLKRKTPRSRGLTIANISCCSLVPGSAMALLQPGACVQIFSFGTVSLFLPQGPRPKHVFA